MCRYLITLKIYNERQEINCRRVDRLVSPSWFVAGLTVAEMACRRDDRTPSRRRPAGRQFWVMSSEVVTDTATVTSVRCPSARVYREQM